MLLPCLVALAAARPAVAQNALDAAPPAEPRVIEKLEVQDTPFSEVINYLRDQDPTFQAVVAYEPGVNRGEPLIQELRLRNVTAPAVLGVLAGSYPQLKVEEGGTDESVIYTIRVGTTDDTPEPREIVTTVYRLNESVDEVMKGEGTDARKQALASILSLVQTAVDAAGDNDKDAAARLKLHEATETLVFKGSISQAELVREALDSLRPSEEDRVAVAERQAERARDEALQWRARFEDAGRATGQNEARAKEQAAELERLRVRLEETSKRLAAAEIQAKMPAPGRQPGPAGGETPDAAPNQPQPQPRQ
jgi:hypothetical protein